MIAIHPLIRRYYDAEERGDIEHLVALFAPDAVVVDEGGTWRGPDAVRAWRERATAAYTWKTELLHAEAEGDTTVVNVRIDGDFPGGSAELRQRFTVEDDRIRRLEIAP